MKSRTLLQGACLRIVMLMSMLGLAITVNAETIQVRVNVDVSRAHADTKAVQISCVMKSRSTRSLVRGLASLSIKNTEIRDSIDVPINLAHPLDTYEKVSCELYLCKNINPTSACELPVPNSETDISEDKFKTYDDTAYNHLRDEQLLNTAVVTTPPTDSTHTAQTEIVLETGVTEEESTPPEVVAPITIIIGELVAKGLVVAEVQNDNIEINVGELVAKGLVVTEEENNAVSISVGELVAKGLVVEEQVTVATNDTQQEELTQMPPFGDSPLLLPLSPALTGETNEGSEEIEGVTVTATSTSTTNTITIDGSKLINDETIPVIVNVAEMVGTGVITGLPIITNVEEMLATGVTAQSPITVNVEGMLATGVTAQSPISVNVEEMLATGVTDQLPITVNVEEMVATGAVVQQPITSQINNEFDVVSTDFVESGTEFETKSDFNSELINEVREAFNGTSDTTQEAEASIAGVQTQIIQEIEEGTLATIPIVTDLGTGFESGQTQFVEGLSTEQTIIETFVPKTITVEAFFGTGMRFEPKTITVETFFGTGMGFEPKTITVEAFFGTGMRFEPKTITVDEMFGRGLTQQQEIDNSEILFESQPQIDTETVIVPESFITQ